MRPKHLPKLVGMVEREKGQAGGKSGGGRQATDSFSHPTKLVRLCTRLEHLLVSITSASFRRHDVNDPILV